MKKDIRTSVIMIAAGLAFGLVFLATKGASAFAQYETAYVLEKMLSIDNLAVMAMIFTAFNTSAADRHKALNYGIAGAIVMRLVFILIGAEALERFEFMSVVFGLILGFSAYKMLGHDDETEGEPKIVSKVRKMFPKASALLLVILAVEASDILFAIDSVPAVLSVTEDRVIAFSSNVAAILGLRALFFVLKNGMDRMRYLNETLAAALAFVGMKMALSHWVHIGELLNIGMIVLIFGVGIAASIADGRRTVSQIA